MKPQSIFISVLATLLLYSCGGGKPKKQDSEKQTSKTEAAYHADNDIAMTVRSVIDAISIGETLDSANYYFRGVLTDGQGYPIYNNLNGIPGNWEVIPVSDTALIIRNVDLGDLMADDLEHYITGNIGLSDADVIEAVSGEHKIVVYDFGGGTLRFETRTEKTPDGLDAPMMLIKAGKHSDN